MIDGRTSRVASHSQESAGPAAVEKALFAFVLSTFYLWIYSELRTNEIEPSIYLKRQ